MLSAFAEPPDSGNSQPADATGAAASAPKLAIANPAAERPVRRIRPCSGCGWVMASGRGPSRCSRRYGPLAGCERQRTSGRPALDGVGDVVEAVAPAKRCELRGCDGPVGARKGGKCRHQRLRVGEGQSGCVRAEACVPADGGALVALRSDHVETDRERLWERCVRKDQAPVSLTSGVLSCCRATTHLTLSL